MSENLIEQVRAAGVMADVIVLARAHGPAYWRAHGGALQELVDAARDDRAMRGLSAPASVAVAGVGDGGSVEWAVLVPWRDRSALLADAEGFADMLARLDALGASEAGSAVDPVGSSETSVGVVGEAADF